MELEKLREIISNYASEGFTADITAAARKAQLDVRNYIARTHPQVAFGGKHIGGMIIRGTFRVEGAGVIEANVYANYFARWYNTGAYGLIIRGRGPRQGQKGPAYEPRGAYFSNNQRAIEQYYADSIVSYLKERVGLLKE